MKILKRPSLKQMSTLKMGGRAREAYFVRDYRDLEILAGIWPELGPQVLVHGKGSNTLFQDGDRDLSLVIWAKNDHPAVVGHEQDKLLVLADAGLSLPGFIRWCSSQGLAGLEGLTGIPGSLGGAVAMNAGSYGFEVSQVLSSVIFWTPGSGIMEVDSKGFYAGYREFRLAEVSGLYIILKACFSLERQDPGTIRSRMKHFYTGKKKSQPVLEKTAGCVFKNPEGFDPAGVLLEKAGFRGRTVGNVCFSAKHSNFLVNTGKGSSKAALDLIAEADRAVFRMFGASLELEIRVV